MCVTTNTEMRDKVPYTRIRAIGRVGPVSASVRA